MPGSLIRCICGTMYDPAQYTACPDCGRPIQARPEPQPKTIKPPTSEVPKPAPKAEPAVAVPGWIWKSGAIAIGLLVVVYLRDGNNLRWGT